MQWHQYKGFENFVIPTKFIEDFYLGKNIFVCFPAEIINNINQILAEKSPHPSSILKTVMEMKQQKRAKPRTVFDFETDNVLEIWHEILQDINAYKIEEQIHQTNHYPLTSNSVLNTRVCYPKQPV